MVHSMNMSCGKSEENSVLSANDADVDVAVDVDVVVTGFFAGALMTPCSHAAVKMRVQMVRISSSVSAASYVVYTCTCTCVRDELAVRMDA